MGWLDMDDLDNDELFEDDLFDDDDLLDTGDLFDDKDIRVDIEVNVSHLDADARRNLREHVHSQISDERAASRQIQETFRDNSYNDY
jgi:hypothetical protein